jgi:replicative DNA helicase
MSYKLKPISEIYATGLAYVKARKTGQIKSLQTPWPAINMAGVNGFEWGTIITIAGRPGTGKTAFVNQFTRAAHGLNNNEDFHVIDFQFEMPDKQTAVREFTSFTGIDYAEILSAYRPIGDNVIDALEQYVNVNQHRDIYVMDTPMTVTEIKDFVLEQYRLYKQKMILTIDHSVLVKLDKGEKDKFEMLYNLGEMMTEIKKRIPVIWIVLTQMNRNMDDSSRKNPGSIANYPTGADIFGADALLQHSDMVMILNHPAKNQIAEYGPKRYLVDPTNVVAHFVKVRNGKQVMAWFDFVGKNAKFNQIPDPPMNGGGGQSSQGLSTSSFKRKI